MVCYRQSSCYRLVGDLTDVVTGANLGIALDLKLIGPLTLALSSYLSIEADWVKISRLWVVRVDQIDPKIITRMLSNWNKRIFSSS